MIREKVLYVIDERGLKGGAHIATELMITALLGRGYVVDVMEAIRRDSFWGIIQRAYERIISTFRLRLSPSPIFLRDPFGFKYRKMLTYDTVCVMSETSKFSAIAAELPSSVRKVQLIHTNYPTWAKLKKRDIADDNKIFAKFDCIGCVGTIGAKQFEEMFPACKGKVFPFHNMIKQRVVSKSHSARSVAQPSTTNLQPVKPIRLISLARINDTLAKDGPRMIRVAKRLYDAGVSFEWENYGGSGNGFVECQNEIERLGLNEVFRIHEYDANVSEKLCDSDIFILLSHYEGLPNSIYEARIAGLPVFASNVGGISEQVCDGKSGWLVPDDEDAIVERLIAILKDVKNNMLHPDPMLYDNNKVVSETEKLLFGHITERT